MTPSSPISFVPGGENSALSSPLSNLSQTPSLPSSPEVTDPTKRYPSPSTTASGPHSPDKMCDLPSEDEIVAKPLDASSEDPPPAKKRRISPPKERTTEYLDLMKPDEELTVEDHRQIKRLLDTLRKKKKIVVIAGAGISVSAGIPDFRSSNGLFATAKNQHNLKGSGKDLFDASVYRHDDTTESFHTMLREMAAMTKNANPTPFHHMLASLAKEGRLLRLYTQNIDCLDTQMEPLATQVPLDPKGPWPVTIQLHGGLQKTVCTKCSSLEDFNGEVFDGPKAPLCTVCKDIDDVRTAHAGKRSHGIGRIRPRVVLYNEYNPDEDAIGSVSKADLKARPDAVIVVGTTLKIPGTRRLVKELCQTTRGRRNGTAIWINVDNEPKDVYLKNCWDIVVRSKCDSVARLAELPPWDVTLGNDYDVTTGYAQKREDLNKTTFAVNIPSGSTSTHSDVEHKVAAIPKQVKQAQGIPTPHASPKLSAFKKPAQKKQSTISFDGKQADKLAPAPAPAAKSRGRKRKNLPDHPMPTLSSKFKTRKNVTSQDRKAKQQKTSNKEISDHSLPSLRPERRPTIESFSHTSESNKKNNGHSSGLPSTPATKKEKDTISPAIIPQCFKGLID
ncbi:DHS-like NAD/FAD-binding domain-containing protein [Fusarium tricinctum]|uniref:DHS-like NAD/FAD-binding domain-containing protein n=1 Tax=Fusarium tricinctum TaxID=61284 RepID=A0A8K0WGL1_9HYPO|nr:DHS-like NAD/FAD-binding domain-containing protein [Fusarium tricinctum]